MFKRRIDTYLKSWSESRSRKPLLIRGARQVGKTTSIRMFAKQFDVYIELNLEREEDRHLFASETDVRRLFNLILLTNGIQDLKGRVLLFIDEIQHSDAAIMSLRYFYEIMPDLFIIAAGSLLEAYLYKSRIGLPVGRISSLWMYPLDFEEFLGAAGQQGLLDSMHEIPFQAYLLPALKQWFRQFALIGGMPEVVGLYLDTNDISQVRRMQYDLIAAYDDDIVKYAQTKFQADAIRFVWKHLPSVVCKQISYSGFGASELRTETVRAALQILQHCGLIHLIFPFTGYELPAIADQKKRPKLLMHDTGLMNYLAGVQAEYFGKNNLNSIYKGIAMEHVVGQMLIANGENDINPLSYWVRPKAGSSAEVDYVFRYDSFLIPLEVKSGKSGTLRSLHQFMENSPQDLAIRLYDGEPVMQKMFRTNKTTYSLLNIPLALSSRLSEYIEYWHSHHCFPIQS